jgi:two-component system response regulator AtoC
MVHYLEPCRPVLKETAASIILVADHEEGSFDSLHLPLRCSGYTVEAAGDGVEVLRYVNRFGGNISLVLMDINIPVKDGIETLGRIRSTHPRLPVIMLSGSADSGRITEALRVGATEILIKPFSPEALLSAVTRAIGGGEACRPLRRKQCARPGEDRFQPASREMKNVMDAVRQAAAWDVPVVFQGESGVGKEVLARSLHTASPRAKKPFVKLNCAALPSELLESELFGYERGAFTGAFKSTPGKFEAAEGGTLLLDEIGDMDLKLQAKLLHVLQDWEFYRLGGKDPVRVNVRVIAATHRDLEKAVRENRFREDLYYRLNVVSIRIPPLRQRKDEILPLIEFFLEKHGVHGLEAPQITPLLKQALLAHEWPGNVRELENVARKLLVFGDPDLVAEELMEKARQGESRTIRQLARAVNGDLSGKVIETDLFDWERVDRHRRKVEADAILEALRAARWNRKKAAALLNIEYKGLLYKMKKLGIERTFVEHEKVLLKDISAGLIV